MTEPNSARCPAPAGMERRCLLIGSAALLLTAAAAPAALAQAYPAKPIRLVHGFGPGATIDIVARPLAQALGQALGQPVVVDGKPGATGTIANEMVVRSPADGHTLLIAPLAAVVTASLLFPIRYDPLKDLLPVIQVARFDTVLVVGPSVTAKSLPELLAQARARPGSLTYASPGIGTGFHLAGELLAQMADVKLLHVPYGGGGKAVLTDLLAGRVDMAFDSLGAMQGPLQAGQVRALAVTGAQRTPALPQVPTVAESGLQGYELGGWHGIFAPAGTPPVVVAQLHAAVAKVLAEPELQKLWRSMDLHHEPASPEAFGARIRSDMQRYSKIIATAGIKLQ